MEMFFTVLILLVFFVSGTPIGLSLLGTSIICFSLFTHIPLSVIANGLFNKLDSFPLCAILYFILLGNIMKGGKSAVYLIDFTKTVMRQIPGGLGIAGISACALFGAISGSATATLVAIGAVAIPPMIRCGYDKSFSIGLLTSASILGIIIPPSIIMIVYAMVANVSVAALFLGGFLPGAIIVLALSVYTFFVRRGREPMIDEHIPFLRAFKNASWSLALPVIVLGGIYGGAFTPTEAAVIGCVYAILIEVLINRTMGLQALVKALQDGGIQTAALLITLAGASVFSDYLTLMQIPQDLSRWVTNSIETTAGFLISVNLLFLFLGTFIDPLSATIIVAPMLLPAMQVFNIDPVFMGVILTINLGIGYITPPLGANLFIASMVMKESYLKIAVSIIPTLIIYFGVLVLLNIFPEIILLLPNWLL